MAKIYYRIFRQLIIAVVTLSFGYSRCMNKQGYYAGGQFSAFRPILPRIQRPQTPAPIAIIRHSDLRRALTNPDVERRNMYPGFNTVVVIGNRRYGPSLEEYQLLFTLFGDLGEVLNVSEDSFNNLLKIAQGRADVLAYLIRIQAQK